MINTRTYIHANDDNFYFHRIGWKYYNHIKKKAMEQKFSWSGLLISLSIAFFIVIFSAFSLSFVYSTVEQTQTEKRLLNNKIYIMEGAYDHSLKNYLQIKLA